MTTLPATDATLFARITPGPGVGEMSEPVTVVHGFAQNSECIGPLADALAEGHPTVLVDAPGHGGSSRHAAADMVRGGELLSTTMPTGVLVGYSMGGRLALRTALDHPEKVTALVLIGATPGIEDDQERVARRLRDHELAAHLESIGLDRFLDEWLALPMFAGLASWARFDTQRRRNTPEGLAGSLKCSGTGSMGPLWRRLAELAVPVLCLTGSEDRTYSATARRMVDLIGPNAEHVVVTGAGHAAHLEAPGPTTTAVLEFLGRFN